MDCLSKLHRRFAPAEIEALLFEHPAVADAAVIGKPDPEAREIPKAFVVRKAGHETLGAEELLAFAKGRLAGYKTVQKIEFVQAIPMPTVSVSKSDCRTGPGIILTAIKSP